MMYVLALLFGAAFSFGLAPFNFWPALAISIVGIYGLLRHGGGRPLWVAWAYGVGKYAVGASWVYVSINVHGNAPPLLAGFLTLLFVVLLAGSFCAPLGWLYNRLRPMRGGMPTGSWSDVVAFSAVWVFMDWVTTWLFTGFPWLLPGYGVLALPLKWLVPVVGVLGAGGLLVLSFTALVGLVIHRRFQVILLSLFLLPWLGAIALMQKNWVEPGAQRSVALVQGNLDQAKKWLPSEAQTNVDKHLRLSADHWDADILVWPEAAITMFPQQAQGLLESIGEQGRRSKTDIVVGIPGVEVLGANEYAFQNLAIGLGEARGRYAKYHLVPFGEFVPLENVLRGLIQFFDLPMSSSTPGAYDQANLELSFGEVAMAICYEIAYPESVRFRAQNTRLLMTISNDTWFGASIGPLQHVQIAQARALENGRWLVRATNNGVTAIVSHLGQITAQLPQFEEGVLRGEVSLMQGRTPYSRAGHWPVLMSLLLAFMWLLWARYRAHESV